MADARRIQAMPGAGKMMPQEIIIGLSKREMEYRRQAEHLEGTAGDGQQWFTWLADLLKDAREYIEANENK